MIRRVNTKSFLVEFILGWAVIWLMIEPMILPLKLGPVGGAVSALIAALVAWTGSTYRTERKNAMLSECDCLPATRLEVPNSIRKFAHIRCKTCGALYEEITATALDS